MRRASARGTRAEPLDRSKRRKPEHDGADSSAIHVGDVVALEIPESSALRTRFAARIVEVPSHVRRAKRERTRRGTSHEAPNDASPELRRLWVAFLESRDDATRNAILRHYFPLVERETRKVRARLPRHVDPADLETAAVLGLIEAIHHFDPERRGGFLVYGKARVRGAILDELRRADWMPRSWRARQAMKRRAEAELRVQLRREPLECEVAEALHVPLDEYRSRYAAPRSAIQAPVGLPSGIGLELFDSFVDPRSEGAHEDLQNREFITTLFDDLTEREESILKLKYYSGWTMGKIGRRLRISESRVCRIHQACLDRLKRRLQPQLQDLVG